MFSILSNLLGKISNNSSIAANNLEASYVEEIEAPEDNLELEGDLDGALDLEDSLGNDPVVTDNAQGISNETSMVYQIKRFAAVNAITAGQCIVKYSPEILRPIAYGMDYIHGLALKTSKHMSKGAEQENSTAMYALAAIPAMVGGIAYAGKFISEQSYDEVARPLGDYVDNQLSHAKVNVAVSGMVVSGESSPENDDKWSEINLEYADDTKNVEFYTDIPATNVRACTRSKEYDKMSILCEKYILCEIHTQAI